MYPVWQMPVLGSALVIAFIASFHILPSHLATSAFWFNVYVEHKAYKENRPELIQFIKKYVLTILIFSFVFGSLSGVGIWYATTVANPRGISALIHTYVWGWATEWVFFVIEVVAIYSYYYTFGKVDKKTHLAIGLIYAIGAWISMIIITGILAFMLSPGTWVKTGSFFDGFFNPTYFPQLFMRTGFMFAIAALYAIAVAGTMKNKDVKTFIVRKASLWGIAGTVAGSLFFLWYARALPHAAHEASEMTALIPRILPHIVIGGLAVLMAWFVVTLIKPGWAKLVPGIVAICIVLAAVFSAESMRERIRKPYVIDRYLYANQIIGHDLPAKHVKSEIPAIDAQGILQYSDFVPAGLRDITAGTMLQAGQIIAQIECSACHTLQADGWLRPLPLMVRKAGLTTVDDAQALIGFLNSFPYMPPFAGTDLEKKALAVYLVSLNK